MAFGHEPFTHSSSLAHRGRDAFLASLAEEAVNRLKLIDARADCHDFDAYDSHYLLKLRERLLAAWWGGVIVEALPERAGVERVEVTPLECVEALEAVRACLPEETELEPFLLEAVSVLAVLGRSAGDLGLLSDEDRRFVLGPLRRFLGRLACARR